MKRKQTNVITIQQAAEIMGICQQQLRMEIDSGKYSFGTVRGAKGRKCYSIFPRLFYLHTGRLPESFETDGFMMHEALLKEG